MNLRIGELIEVPPVKTVIRLEEGRTQSATVSASFVCTAEVTTHLNVLAAALSRHNGTGCFIEGDFGSGKSHFLAALSVWLDNRPGAELLGNANAALNELRMGGKKFLPVEISLVEYRSSTPLERIITSAIEKAFLLRGIGAVLSPVKRFLSHLRTILEVPSTARTFVESVGVAVPEIDAWFDRDPKGAFSKSLAFLERIGIDFPELLVDERNEVFARALDLAKTSGFDGMVLIIDELSEFFRSKPDPAALNEDARTLQLLGEMATSQPLWIIAAVQESIERTGDIASVTFRKIKDRFPVRLHLSTLHIRDLLSGRLIRRKEGAAEKIRIIHEEYRTTFPRFAVPFDQFLELYPLHPATLSLLEGLGELFSQHRGIVDFVHARLAGDPSRNIPGILDRCANELLAPDALFDHFQSRLAEISAFNAFPRQIVPHLDSIIKTAIDGEEDQALARRCVRILVLYAVHPTAKPPSASLLTELCACMFAPHDPLANVQFLSSAILDPLMAESRFITRKDEAGNNPASAVYTISAVENVAGNLQARIRQAMSEIRTDDSRILLEPLRQLETDLSWPGQEILRGPMLRTVLWRQSVRRAVIGFAQAGSESMLAEKISAIITAGDADFGMVLAPPGTHFTHDTTMVWQFGEKGTADTVLVEYFAALTVSRELHLSNPAHAPLVTPAADHIKRLEPVMRQTVLELLYRGEFENAPGLVDGAALQLRRFDRLLEAAAEQLLDRKYPRYREIAPRQPVSSRLYQRLLNEFVVPGSLTMSEARTKALIESIETQVVPLGLVELKSGSYRLAPALGEHEFLSHALSLIQPSGATAVTDFLRNIASGAWGVPRETAEFLLFTLAQCGIIALQSHGRTLALDLLPMMSIDSADEIVAGELVSQADRDTLLEECSFLAPPGQWGSFGLRQQREAWQSLTRFKNSTESILAETARQFDKFENYSAFSSFDFSTIRRDAEALAKVIAEVKVSWHAREGIERFLAAWRLSELDASLIDRIRNVHRFLDRFADKFIFIAHYLRNQSVENGCSADPGLSMQRSTVQMMLDDPLAFVVADEGAQISAAFELFRENYQALYEKKHQEHAALVAPPPLNRLQERILNIIGRLGSIDQIEMPAGVEKLLAAQRESGKKQCTRSIAEELLRSPVCGCGFQVSLPGEVTASPAPAVSVDEAFKMYQHNLRRPEILEAVTAYAFALRDMDGATAERLDKLGVVLRDTSAAPRVLADLLDEASLNELERALSGSMQVQSRSIGEFFGQLKGKRLTPGRVRRLFEQWMGQVPDNMLLSIDDPAQTASAQQPSWWPALHPELMDDALSRISGEATREFELALEQAYPSEMVRKKLQTASQATLLHFINNERFHTAAIRTAWQLLLKKTVNHPSLAWPSGVADSSHGDPQTARGITNRLSLLGRVQQLLTSELPERVSVRTVLSELWTDEWCSAETKKVIEHEIATLEKSADDWLQTLPHQPQIDLALQPVVLLIDGLPPDTWIEAFSSLAPLLVQAQTAWFRISSSPNTLPALDALFGLDHTLDPTDALQQAGARYQTFRGDEEHPLTDLIPPLSDEGAVVLRLNIVDSAAHGGTQQLHRLPGLVAAMLQHHLPLLIEQCRHHKRMLILTTDHGLSWQKGALRHGKGGVFEEAVIRVEWL